MRKTNKKLLLCKIWIEKMPLKIGFKSELNNKALFLHRNIACLFSFNYCLMISVKLNNLLTVIIERA